MNDGQGVIIVNGQPVPAKLDSRGVAQGQLDVDVIERLEEMLRIAREMNLES